MSFFFFQGEICRAIEENVKLCAEKDIDNHEDVLILIDGLLHGLSEGHHGGGPLLGEKNIDS